MNLQKSKQDDEKMTEKESGLRRTIINMKGTFAILYILTNTLIGYPFLLTAALLKLVIPFNFSRKFFTRILNFIATTWLDINNILYKKILGVKIEVTGEHELSPKEWYMVLSNHQSWSDIVVLQMVFNRRIPLLKFFIKKELIWVPLLGIAWWALDFPFMKRFSSEFLKAHPEMKGKDIEITRKACEKFKYTPVSVMNFVEGTRFTPAKHAKQKSPYKNLLKPKAGGTGFVFTAMGSMFHSILNITIKYPEMDYSIWSFLCGRVHKVDVHIEKLPIDEKLIGDYENDEVYRNYFCQWLNDLWHEKDKLISKLK
ncbi:MAG TPA: acyltransferase [Spirochaetota bacterium]|nr:acyltransferase [Spirochaetota bacterium]